MAITTKTGAIGTNALLAANVKPDILDVLKVLEPYKTPLFSWLFLSEKKSKVVRNAYAKFSHMEKEFLPRILKTHSSAITDTSGVVALTSTNLPDIGALSLNDIVFIEGTGEMGYISAVASETGKTLTALDSQSYSTNLTDIPASSYLRIIGKRVFEYHGRIDYKSTQEVEISNYLNEFVAYVQTSGRQEAGEYWTDGMTHDERVEQRIKELKLEVENYLWFSNADPKYVGSGNLATTFGKGVNGFVTTNVNGYATTLTEPVFRAHLKSVHRLGSNKKIHFCGEEQMEDIEAFMQDYYQVTQTGNSSFFNEIGLEAKTFRTFGGLTTIVWNPMFDGKFVDWGWTLDEENVMLRYMADDKKGSRKFRVRSNTQDNDTNGTETEILMDVAIQVMHERSHGRLYKSS